MEKYLNDKQYTVSQSLIQYLIKQDKNNPTYLKTEVYMEKENGHYSIKNKNKTKEVNQNMIPCKECDCHADELKAIKEEQEKLNEETTDLSKEETKDQVMSPRENTDKEENKEGSKSPKNGFRLQLDISKCCDQCKAWREYIEETNKPKSKFSNRKNKKVKDISYSEKNFFQQLSNYFAGIDKFLFTNICTYHSLLMNALDRRVEAVRNKIILKQPVTYSI